MRESKCCPTCGMKDPSWQHLAWEAQRKRAREREIERRIEREEKDQISRVFPYLQR